MHATDNVPPSDLRQHFQDVADAVLAGKLVPFLGAGVNLCDRPSSLAYSPDQTEYLVIIALVAGGFAWYTYYGLEKARNALKKSNVDIEQALERAQKGELINLSQSLVQAAQRGVRTDPNRSLILELHALTKTRGLPGETTFNDAKEALRQTIVTASGRSVQNPRPDFWRKSNTARIVWRKNGRDLAILGDVSALIDASTGRVNRTLDNEDEKTPATWDDRGKFVSSNDFVKSNVLGFSQDGRSALLGAEKGLTSSVRICTLANLRVNGECRSIALPEPLDLRSSNVSAAPNIHGFVLTSEGGIKGIYLIPVPKIHTRESADYEDNPISWSGDGRYLAVSRLSTTGPNLQILDAATLGILHSVGTDGIFFGTTWMPDSKTVLGATFSEVYSVNVTSGEKKFAFYPRQHVIAALAASPDGKQLLVAGLGEAPTIHSLEALYSDKTEDLVKMAKSLVHGNLSESDCKTLLREERCPPVP